jgi:flagellar protein FlgJ
MPIPALLPLASAALAAATPAMRKAAEAFESQALSQLLAPAFDTVDMSKSSFGGGAAEQQWRPMLLDAMAATAVRGHGGIGLTSQVLKTMLQRQEAAQAGGGEA